MPTQEIALPDIEYYRERFNPVRDIESISPENWKPECDSRRGFGRSDDRRYLSYTLSAEVKDHQGSDREYVFTVKFDLLLAAQVGTPKLEVFGPIVDDWKPIREALALYEGSTAAMLFSLVRRAVMPSNGVESLPDLSNEEFSRS